jgi:hypothetical protein
MNVADPHDRGGASPDAPTPSLDPITLAIGRLPAGLCLRWSFLTKDIPRGPGGESPTLRCCAPQSPSGAAPAGRVRPAPPSPPAGGPEAGCGVAQGPVPHRVRLLPDSRGGVRPDRPRERVVDRGRHGGQRGGGRIDRLPRGRLLAPRGGGPGPGRRAPAGRPGARRARPGGRPAPRPAHSLPDLLHVPGEPVGGMQRAALGPPAVLPVAAHAPTTGSRRIRSILPTSTWPS